MSLATSRRPFVYYIEYYFANVLYVDFPWFSARLKLPVFVERIYERAKLLDLICVVLAHVFHVGGLSDILTKK